MKRCLYCYQPIEKEIPSEFHERCSKAFFGTAQPPALSLAEDDLEKMARQIINARITIPGVQRKLSMNIEQDPTDPKKSRLTIVGLWGKFILKPQAINFPNLPENEDLTMHLASLAGITTAHHTLIRTTQGQLAYLTKRFDRTPQGKLLLEDLCQLSEVPSSDRHKYNSTMERVGKVIAKYSSARGLDMLSYFELVLFSFISGNADMHMKNFSILKDAQNQYRLSPAYDLLCTILPIPEDKEQMAMHLNAKQNKIKRKDFLAFASNLKIEVASAERMIKHQTDLIHDFADIIDISFLSSEMKLRYKEVINTRIDALQ